MQVIGALISRTVSLLLLLIMPATSPKQLLRTYIGMTHMSCAGHTLNLSVQAGLNVASIQTVLGQCRKVVTHFNHSHLHLEELHARQELLHVGLDKHKLLQVNKL